MLDRRSRRYVIEHLSHINQGEVVAAIRRMKRRKALRTVRSVTTDIIRNLALSGISDAA